MSLNACTEELVNYYVKSAPPGEFALLIAGRWGSGKTHFLKRHLQKNDIDHVYVSVNGLADIQSVNDEVLAQFHPRLHGPKSRLARRLLTKGLTSAIGVNIGDDESELIDNLFKEFKEPKGKLIIFDDIERAEVSAAELLGYIRALLEQGGGKVILVGDESELFDEADRAGIRSYNRIKEKTVGVTTTIIPEFEDTVVSFTEDIKTESVRDFLTANSECIREVFDNGRHENLRMLRFAFIEFERLVKTAELERFFEKELGRVIFKWFLILSFEIKAGKIKGEEHLVEQLSNSKLYRLPNTETDDNHEQDYDFREAYNVSPYEDMVLPPSDWVALCIHGRVDKEKLGESIQNSLKSEEVNWGKLWNMWSLSPSEFDNFLSKTIDDLKLGNFENINEITHCFGLLHFISLKTQSSSLNKGEVEELCQSAVTKWLKNQNEDVHKVAVDYRAFAGKGFYSSGTEELHEFVDYIKDRINEHCESSLIVLLNELPEKLKVSKKDYVDCLVQIDNKLLKIEDQLVVSKLDIDELIEGVLAACRRGDDIRDVETFLFDSTKRSAEQSLDEELKFLVSLVCRVEELSRRDTLSMIELIKLNDFVEGLKKDIEDFTETT
ncbi:MULTISPECIES: P-loop NTPase fold protein [Idiomarina]|uniref:P-loop NTPase fold protein n=1 Tax=Idiomarina TaxID=135575 RepID=UPI000C64C3C5|nr:MULTISPECIES: P-loop NTPase fold protein [Idiomarina]MBP59441.1 hypothetical protein [Idiomarina sp.]|tara:strand:+ start:13789 stop:15615 length:1827 start_codon:yes stop_codon:yes gene_type:complete